MPLHISSSHLRKISVRQDLLEIADLIELCFSSTLDKDGREYLRHLRWAARDAYYLSWLQNAAERLSAPLNGFVWEEDGKIVGNLSLIPMLRGGRFVYWIANVAVHPEYRRRGIARELTHKALAHLRERGVRCAWLQVRSDNPAAQQLYLSLGFVERLRRTTWLAHPHFAAPDALGTGVVVGNRRSQDWERQEAWLLEAYPADVSWNLPFKVSRFKPGFIHRLVIWLQGETQRNWAAMAGERPLGFASWEPGRASSDSLWVAAPPDCDPQALTTLLAHARRELRYRGKPLQVNYPAEWSQDAFYRAGFQNHQTLIWMMASL